MVPSRALSERTPYHIIVGKWILDVINVSRLASRCMHRRDYTDRSGEGVPILLVYQGDDSSWILRERGLVHRPHRRQFEHSINIPPACLDGHGTSGRSGAHSPSGTQDLSTSSKHGQPRISARAEGVTLDTRWARTCGGGYLRSRANPTCILSSE